MSYNGKVCSLTLVQDRKRAGSSVLSTVAQAQREKALVRNMARAFFICHPMRHKALTRQGMGFFLSTFNQISGGNV